MAMALVRFHNLLEILLPGEKIWGREKEYGLGGMISLRLKLNSSDLILLLKFAIHFGKFCYTFIGNVSNIIN